MNELELNYHTNYELMNSVNKQQYIDFLCQITVNINVSLNHLYFVFQIYLRITKRLSSRPVILLFPEIIF